MVHVKSPRYGYHSLSEDLCSFLLPGCVLSIFLIIIAVPRVARDVYYCYYLQTVLWNSVSDGRFATYSKTVKRTAIFRIKFARNFRIKEIDKFKQHNNDVTM